MFSRYQITIWSALFVLITFLGCRKEKISDHEVFIGFWELSDNTECGAHETEFIRVYQYGTTEYYYCDLSTISSTGSAEMKYLRGTFGIRNNYLLIDSRVFDIQTYPEPIEPPQFISGGWRNYRMVVRGQEYFKGM